MKTKFKLIAPILLTLSIPIIPLSIAHATPGDLDTAFAGTGKVRIGFGGGLAQAYAAATQSDGKLILAGYGNGISDYYQGSGGDFLIARFTTDNTLDTSFGDGGKVLTRVTPVYPTFQLESSAIKALAVQADGKIIAAGFAYQNTNYLSFTLVRYNPDGSLDTTFGTNGTGIVYTDLGGRSQITAMAVQPDGEIVVAGFVGFPDQPGLGSGSGIALARYQTNGVLDAGFGSGGTIVMPSSGEYNALYGLMIESGGNIVAVGASPGGNSAIYQFTTSGVLDASFGSGGEVTTPAPWAADSVGIQFGNNTIQNPNKLVVAGGSYIVRCFLNGTLDTNFANGGVLTNAFGNIIGLAVQGQLLQPRTITVAGESYDANNYYFSMARFTGGGTLDTTFGTNGTGIVALPMANRNLYPDYADPRAMTFQSGNFVLAGDWGVESGLSKFAAARFTSGGVPDTTFGSNGVLLAELSDAAAQAHAVAIQPDGKMVVAGQAAYFTNNSQAYSFALARLNPDGSLDDSFGSNGKVTTPLNSAEVANAVAMESDGKIVAAGSLAGGGSDFVLARYNADGSLDTSFGSGGTTAVPVGYGSDDPDAVQIQSDGKIVVAGSAEDSTSHEQFAVARFNTNGVLDTSFGSSGIVITTFGSPPSVAEAYGAGIQPDGKIVAVGLAIATSGSSVTSDMAAARYNTNGALDFSFGSLGRTQANVGGSTLDVGYAMAIQPDGKIIVAGGAGIGDLPGPADYWGHVNAFVALARFDTNGAPDTTFGNNGTVVSEVGAYSDFAMSLALQPDGKIVIAGASQNGNYKWFAQRYNADGSLDTSYGNNSAALLDFGSDTNEVAYGLALDSFGRAVIAGDAGGVFGVARLQGDFVASPSLKIFLTSTNTAVISWPYPSTGWSLQQAGELSTSNWITPPETIANDGTNNFIVVTPPSGNLFFRLQQ